MVTGGPGEARELARRAPGAVIVAVGGDGTVNEVANGIVGLDKTLGVIPAGSGNDFIKAIGVPKKTDKALEILLAGKSRRIDVGTVAFGDSNPPGRYFVNGVGVGLDAAVAKRTTEITYIGGTAVYLLAILQTMWTYRSPNFERVIDSVSSSSRNLLIAIGNGPCAGGGFFLTPDAKVDDGLLDLCIVEDVSVSEILRLIPKVMTATHHHAKGIRLLKARTIVLSSDRQFYVHADGEIVGNLVNRVEVGLAKERLNVIVA